MDDPPVHSGTLNRGHNLRPPTMIERRLANASPGQYGRPQQQNHGAGAYNAYGTQDGYAGDGGYGYAVEGYEEQQQHSFVPGQVIPSGNFTPGIGQPLSPTTSMASTPTSGRPLISPAAYAAGGQYEAAYNEQGQLARQPSHVNNGPTMSGAIMNRQPSNGAHLARQPSSADPQAHYVDLDRSSVTPYQAAQYAEISRRLNTEVPGGLPSPLANAAAARIPADAKNLGAVTEDEEPAAQSPARTSPFADPSTDFPLPPPSPVHRTATRIDSTPPQLPEIYLQQRAFSPVSYDFPSSARPSPSPFSTTFPESAAAVPAAAQKAAKVTVPEPAAVAGGQANARSPLGPGERKRPDTMCTVYDPEDAYGGF